MSRKRKPQPARRERQATLTQRQRHRLNDNRPPVAHGHPNQAAEPLLSSKALGTRILNAVRLADVAPDLEAQVDGPATRRGPKRRFRVEALLAAMVIAGHDNAKSYNRTDVVLALIGLDAAVAYEMGVCTDREWKDITYPMIARRVKELESVLQLGWFQDGEYRNFEWVSTRLLGASIPPAALQAITAAALDETPRPMWARRTTVFENQAELERQAEKNWRKENPGRPVPSDPLERIPMIEAEAIRRGWEVGPDGRLLHGKDPDARMGWATATSHLPGGYYVGYGLTLLVACPEALWRGNPYEMALGEPVPLYILALHVNGAGTDSGPTGRRVVESGRTNAPNVKDVTADRGYTPKRETFARPVRELGINITMDLKQLVRGRVKTITVGATNKSRESVHLNCGTFLPHWITQYWEQPPARLLRPDKKDDLAQWHALRAKLLRLADRGYFRTKAGEITGAKRFQCPACAGFCDDPTAKTPPTYDHPPLAKPGTTRCCGGVVTIKVEDLDDYQLIPYGTPAWQTAYGRRNLVETVNSMLKPDKGREIGRCQAFGLAANTMASIALAVAHNLKETTKTQRAKRATKKAHKPKTAHQPADSQATDANENADHPTDNEEPPGEIAQAPPTTAPDADGNQPPPKRPPNRAPP